LVGSGALFTLDIVTSEPEVPRNRWQRLRRHGAFQAGLIFASAAWLVLQAADVFALPTTLVRVLGVALVTVLAVLTVYAWVDTRAEKAAHKRGKTRRWHAALAAAVVLLVLGAASWLLRPRLFGGLKPGADVIAVLPFNTSGPSVALLGEGLVDLLSANLNEVGVIRTIDPRTTLHRWKQVATDGSVDLAGSLGVGRAVGAGSVLLGSVIEVGGTARLSAQLIAVDGRELASATMEGRSDSVFTLVDRLSIDLLRDIWRAREPLPELRLAAITTSSPEALRAYLRGEQFFRRSQWDSAQLSFGAAIDQDSTFALAHFRLGEAYGWSESLGSASARRHAEAAERFAERLPTPERTLVFAHRLHEQGDADAIDTLRAFVSRYPDDPGGWHLLADAQFHAQMLLDLTPETLFAPFDRTLALDPSFTPALEHPLEASVNFGDSIRFRRYLNDLETFESEPRQVAFFRALGEVRFGPRPQRLGAFASALRSASRSIGDNSRLLRAYTSAVLADSLPVARDLSAAYDTARVVVTSPQNRLAITLADAMVAGSTGQFRRGRLLLDTIRDINPQLAFSVVLPIRFWGMAPSDYGAREVAFLQNPPTGAVSQGLQYGRASFMLGQGELPRARILIDSSAAMQGNQIPAPFFDVVRGWIRVAEGDTAGGIQQIEASMRRGGYSPQALGMAAMHQANLALLRVQRAETRASAMGQLRLMFAQEPILQVLLAIPLADAYERAGMREEAARTLALFITILEQGDPDVQPHLDAARRSLERLVAERSS